MGEERVEVRDATGAVLHAEPTDGSSAGLRRALDVIDALGLDGELVVRRPSLDDVFFALTETPAATAPQLVTTGRNSR